MLLLLQQIFHKHYSKRIHIHFYTLATDNVIRSQTTYSLYQIPKKIQTSIEAGTPMKKFTYTHKYYKNIIAKYHYNMEYDHLHPYGQNFISINWNNIIRKEWIQQPTANEFKKKYTLRMKLVRP